MEKTFTLEELSLYNGADGRPIYIAYKGKVYDVSSSPLFEYGMHFEHYSGEDLTQAIEDAPHGDEVIHGFPFVGILTG